MLLFTLLKQITNCVAYLVLFSLLNCPDIRNFWISQELSFSSFKKYYDFVELKKKYNLDLRGKMAV